MGQSCVCVKKESRIFKRYAKIFDSFDFRVNHDDEFTFLQRAKRELSGGNSSDVYILNLYLSYRNFIIDCCVKIDYDRKSKEPRNQPYFFTAPPFIDEMWQLAILYTHKYRELCIKLVGETIHRIQSTNQGEISKHIKALLPDYNLENCILDNKFTVWVYNKDIVFLINTIYDNILKTKDIYNKIRIASQTVPEKLMQIKTHLEKINADNKFTNRKHIPLESHEFYNINKKESVKEIFEKIKKFLPENLCYLVEKKYSTSCFTQIYIDEYCKFMTMIFFSTHSLTPSEEVDQVWHTHQSLTLEYETFCNSIFGRLIFHNPTVGGESENLKFLDHYNETLKFYNYLFGEGPIKGVWPKSSVRFDSKNFVGGWISLNRLFQCVLRVIEILRKKKSEALVSQVIDCYYSWNGRNFFRKNYFRINLNKRNKYRQGYEEKYWAPGGCSVFTSENGCGGGCGGGCGVGSGTTSGCGGNGCGANRIPYFFDQRRDIERRVGHYGVGINGGELIGETTGVTTGVAAGLTLVVSALFCQQ